MRVLEEPALADLVRRGIITPAARPFVEALPRESPVMKLDRLLRELDDDRADRSDEPPARVRAGVCSSPP